jgi:hypothetical protein
VDRLGFTSCLDLCLTARPISREKGVLGSRNGKDPQERDATAAAWQTEPATPEMAANPEPRAVVLPKVHTFEE